MPINRHIAKAEAEVYAASLVDNANEEGGLDAVLNSRIQMEAVIAYNRSHIDLTELVEDPEYTPEQLNQAIKRIFADCQPALQSVLGVMAERGDIDMLPRVWESFNQQIVKKLHVNVIDVTTRVPLDDHLRQVIKEKAGKDLGSDVALNEVVDPTLLGGIIMSANGKRIDASVDTLLEEARNVLKMTPDGGEC